MPKYKVYAIATASWPVGEYEADDADKAKEMALADDHASWTPELCHQCARVDIGDVYEEQADEVFITTGASRP